MTPASVFVYNADSGLQPLISAAEINACTELDELKRLLKEKL